MDPPMTVSLIILRIKSENGRKLMEEKKLQVVYLGVSVCRVLGGRPQEMITLNVDERLGKARCGQFVHGARVEG